MSAATDDPIVTYECPIAGETHAVPSSDVRILKIGDGGFVFACDCGPEPLADVDEPPHPTTDHLVNVYADDPSPEQWLRLEDAAQGWHDTTRWARPDGFAQTNGKRRHEFRAGVKEIADTDHERDLDPTAEERRARAVACPACGADDGQKCQRPSGHRVRTPHADRVETAADQGVIDRGGDEPSREQAGLDVFARS